MASIIDVETSGSKSDLADRIADFLEKPKSSGKEYKAVVKGGKASTKASGKGSKKAGKGTKRSADGVKRTPSSYIIYSNERRDPLREENPKMKITEISGLIGAEWRAMSDKAKEKYTKKAEALKKAAGGGSSKGSKKVPLFVSSSCFFFPSLFTYCSSSGVNKEEEQEGGD